MRKLVTVLGIAMIVAGVICGAYALFNWFLNNGTCDASNEFYDRTYHHAIIFSVVAAVVAVLGVLALIFKGKIGK